MSLDALLLVPCPPPPLVPCPPHPPGALSTPTLLVPCIHTPLLVPCPYPPPMLLQVAQFSPLDADLVLYTAPGGSESASVLNTYSISHHKVR